jgi:hypothetical protein
MILRLESTRISSVVLLLLLLLNECVLCFAR